MSVRGIVLAFVIVAAALLGVNSVFVVTELERAVLLEFGKVVNSNILPGLHFKKPFINEVRKFDARVTTLDAPAERYLTLEKKALIVDSFAKYKVSDVETYYTSTSGDPRIARDRLKERINSGLRDEISSRTLHDVVSGERDLLMTNLIISLNEVTTTELGIEVVDVRVKRIDLPPEVSQSVYNRMNTERDIEAREHRAEGQEQAVRIRAEAEREKEVTLANAYRDSEILRGDGDAKAANTYASAYSRDKEFYRFSRSMSAYQRTFSNKGDILLVDPDSDFFSYLNKSKKE
jgi:membrane protease subunit HflC